MFLPPFFVIIKRYIKHHEKRFRLLFVGLRGSNRGLFQVIWWQAREIAATDALLRAVFFFAKALRDSRSVGAWLMFLSAFERARGLAPASPETVAKPLGNYVWPRGNGVD